MERIKSQHVVLFPFMTPSHINPFLALAHRLVRHHPALTVTLVNTRFHIQCIRSSSFPSSIRLRSLPFDPAAHGLHPDDENFATVPNHQKLTFLVASESLLPAFDQLIVDIAREDGRPPLCIVADFLLAWTADVAHRYEVFHSVFIPGGAYGMAVFVSLWTHLPHLKTRSDEFALSEFPDTTIHLSQLSRLMLLCDGTDPTSGFHQRLISQWKETNAMLVNTVDEMEATGLRMLRKLFPVPTWAIGPLLISSHSVANASQNRCIMEWLDSQQPASVLYVSFGSLCTITASQMMEVATGLEASEARFIWVIRPPSGFDSNEEFKAEWLPEKFEERMRERGTGVLVHGWAPQLEILSHTSTGAFLSHCGWNSVLESLSRGVPIVAWPLLADQPHNAKMMEEMGVCVEVARGSMESSKADRTDVERVIREVMCGGEKAKEMRRRAEEVGELMRAAWREGVGSSFKGLADFFRAAASMGDVPSLLID
ncbi:unnamed protein product [Musa acuminata subsp. burmannicoides]